MGELRRTEWIVRRRIQTIIESAVAFVAILVVSCGIYFVGKLKAPQPVKTEETVSAYACGEKLPVQQLRISHTLYRYLIYFVIVDSSAVLMAFASLTVHSVNGILLLAYLCTVLVSCLLLVGGD